jgi:DNA invertase Pin-like site-specific DNA recombinase
MPPTKRKDGEPKRVVLYIRFSSWKQDAENTKEGQLNALQAYADERGYIVVGIYIDEAVSGKRDDRADFNRLMRAARSRERPFDEVLIWKFDRFGRRASTIDRRATELEELGIGVTAIRQPLEGKPAVVKFFRTMLGGFAEYVSDNMGEDIARGMQTAASHGVWTNSSVPFGLMKDYRKDRGRMRPFLIPDPDTSWIIVRLFEMYLDGTGSAKIAETFRDEEVPNATEKPWTGPDVTRRLKNIAYAGWIQHGKRSKFDDAALLAPWPEMELASMEDYNRAQEIMASHTPKITHPREVASVHLLAGRVFCDECNCKMSPTGGERSYYNCNHRRRHLSSCDTPNPPADLLDAAALRHVFDRILIKENTERVLAIVAKSQTETTIEVEEELRNISLEIEKQKTSRRKLLQLFDDEEKDVQWGDISERMGEIREALTRLEANALEAKAKVSNEKALISNPEKVAAYVQDLKNYLRGTNLDLTKEILRELIVQVRVLPGETKDTATLIIKYRIPTPPKGWSNEADVEELLLRQNARSLAIPAHPGDAPLLHPPGLEGVFLSLSLTVS